MIYDLECQNCGHIEKDVICHFNQIAEYQCECCGKKMMHNIAFCKSFELKYDPKKDMVSWGFDNYATSQYYNDVNKKNECESKTIISGPGYSGKKNIYKGCDEN